MGQYFKLVNEDKHEQITAWEINGGAKFFEWLYNNQARILVWLLRKSDEGGGGDIPDPEGYPTLGTWAGDRITLIGDYDSSKLWDKTEEWENIGKDIMGEYNEAVRRDGLSKDMRL
jgi:hypothetical protein